MVFAFCICSTQLAHAQGVGYNPVPTSFQNTLTTSCSGGGSAAVLPVSFDFYKAGVTDAPGAGAGTSCEILLRSSSAMRDATHANATPVMTTFPATYNSDNGSNDRYEAIVPVALQNGRYTWECKCSHGGTDYYSWDYGTTSGNSLQFFTVGSAGLYRSMVILDAGSGNEYFDMLKFMPGNIELPAVIPGPNGNGGFCTSDPLLFSGGEINTYKNNWNGDQGNICGGTIFVEIEVASVAGAGCTVAGGVVKTSVPLLYRDDCPIGYNGQFSGGGSCQTQDANSLDQRWDEVASGLDLTALATTLCDPTTSTGDVTYTLKFHTEVTYDCANGCTITEREPAVGAYTTSFKINGDSDIGCGMQLPVELLEFTGRNLEDNNVLNWSTASESNSSHFEIERSLDGTDFLQIGRVDAAFESNVVMDYGFVEEDVKSGNYVYRLKMVDLDDSYEYSDVLNIRVEGKKLSIKANPNPSFGQIEIQSNSTKKQLEISVFSMVGQLVEYAEVDSNSAQMDLSHLAKGIYLLNVSNGEEYTTEKLVLR